MPGMMSPEQMSSLAALSGPDFDRMWLEMMINHHTGAIDMAETEQATGTNPEAKKLADSIITAQQSEIDRMKAMLGQNRTATSDALGCPARSVLGSLRCSRVIDAEAGRYCAGANPFVTHSLATIGLL